MINVRKREVMIVKALDEWFGNEQEGLNHASLSYTDYRTVKNIIIELMRSR
jgi:hypothetical protein